MVLGIIKQHEMEKAEEIDECQAKELRVAQEEEELRRSIEDLAVEYQRELWCRHYFEHYDNVVLDDDDDELSLGHTEFAAGDTTSGHVVNISSDNGEA